MNEEKKLKIETDKILATLEKEKIIYGAIKVYNKTLKIDKPAFENSQVQIEGDIVIVRLRDEGYNLLKTYRVFDGRDYIEQKDL